MSYRFYNNWPYYNTVFPTMEDHVDPINNTYFSGLMQELQNIENYLGLHPQGGYGTVDGRFLGTAHKNVSIINGEAEKTGFSNTDWYVDHSVFGAILPWAFIRDNFNVYVKFGAWLSNSSGVTPTYCKIAWEDSNFEFHDIGEIQYSNSTAMVVMSDWIDLTALVDTEDDWIYIAAGYKVVSGTGNIYHCTVSLRFEIKQ